MDLEGRVALVTGGGSGIGAATARRLAEEGMRVCVVDMNGDSAATVADEIGGFAVAADVSDSRQVDSAFAACMNRFGCVDLAHLNAGFMGYGDIGTISDADYERNRGANLDGVVFGARATIRAVRERADGREGGVIVATASIAGLEGYPRNPLYSLTKHAIIGFIRSLGPALVAEGMAAHAVCPSLVDTPLPSAEAKAAFVNMGGTMVRPTQVADAVVAAATASLDLSGTCWVVNPDETTAHRFNDVPGAHSVLMRPGLGGDPPSGS